MIRKANSDDLNKIKNLLMMELGEFNHEELIESFNNNISSLVYENTETAEVLAFAITAIPNAAVKRGIMLLYASESVRGRGIGTELYAKSMECCSKENIEKMIIDIRGEKFDTSGFFINRGFHKWYSATEMEYRGEKLESSLELAKYDEKYYESYKNAFEDGFLGLRQALGFSPLRDCYKYEELIERKDKTFVLMDEDEIIGSVYLPGEEIDDFFVNQKYQGKGYGRKIFEFAISHYQKLGVEKIYLGVADWNEKAVSLYRSFGFVDTKKNVALRMDLAAK